MSNNALLIRPPPLHVAIWEGDIERVRSLLDAVCPVNEESRDPVKAEALKQLLEFKDIRGNSALHLAVRIVQPRQQAIVKLLLERDASVASRNLDGWSCAHDAALCDDEYMLAQIYLRGEKQVIRTLESTQEMSIQALEKLPDFEAEIFLEAHSWVPIVSSVLPSDTIKIRKRGSQLRVDFALKGLDGIKWKKGQISQLYMGRYGGDRAGHAVVMDHQKKVFYDIFKAMHNSSVGNMDLALQVSLTTAMSSSRMDVAQLEFVKRKEVKAEEEIDKKKFQGKKSRSKQRKCPWRGTTYKMKNVLMEAQFRPVVNQNRKMRNFPTGKDSPFDEVQQFVQHLYSSVPHSRENNVSKSEQRDRSSSSSESDSNNDIVGQTIKLKKGRKVEMHLDVIAGDSIRWEFLGKSSDFYFAATYYHEDQEKIICRSDGVKNAAIGGAFEVEHNGSFVLMWQNTQKGFTIDRRGIAITYDIKHTRPASDDLSVTASLAADVLTPAQSSSETMNESSSFSMLSDEQKCEFFRQHNHVPNPLTITTAFVDYFMLDESASALKDPKKDEAKKESLVFKFFQDKKQQEQTTTQSLFGEPELPFDIKNSFRNLTLLPLARRMHKSFEAKVVMSESFPVQPRDFIPVIEFLSTTGEHMKNLESFFQMKLPSGFPVKFELPMMFTIRVAYTFQKFTLNPQFDPKIFTIPSDYHEVFTLDEVRS